MPKKMKITASFGNTIKNLYDWHTKETKSLAIINDNTTTGLPLPNIGIGSGMLQNIPNTYQSINTNTGSTAVQQPAGITVHYAVQLTGITVHYSDKGFEIDTELYEREGDELCDEFFARVKGRVEATVIELELNSKVAERLRGSFNFSGSGV